MKTVSQSLSTFDRTFIFLIPLFACLICILSFSSNVLFDTFLKLNIVFLGYHHVISTYTRICFSINDLNKNKFLVIYLPLIVFPLVFVMSKYIGIWTIGTLYFYWQFFHYTRQSFGISRYYLRTKDKNAGDNTINNLSIYLFPFAGILYRSYQNPDQFLELSLRTLPVSDYLFLSVLVVASICIGMQLITWIRLLMKKKLNIAYASYMLSHYLIFLVGYFLIDDVTIGWLCINIWHNAQYIFFVWMSNNRRFKKGYNKDFGLISKVSQKKYLDEYILLCLGVTVIFYGIMQLTTMYIENYTSLPMIMITFMTINFHHYIVDSVIWTKKNNTKISLID